MLQLNTYVKQGDTRPAIEVELGVDLSGVDPTLGVQFTMTTPDNVIIVQKPAQILDYTQGIVAYQWRPGDTDTPSPAGVGHKAEFAVTFPDGSTETFPNTGYIAVYILPTLSP